MTPDGSTALLGTVVGGSLAEGVEVRLAEGASVESIPVGSYVVIQGESPPVLRHGQRGAPGLQRRSTSQRA